MSHDSIAARFNATGFSRWVNGTHGRTFRLVAGVAWLTFGLVFRDHWWGVAAMLDFLQGPQLFAHVTGTEGLRGGAHRVDGGLRIHTPILVEQMFGAKR